jgi:hypothetical protein
MAWSEHVAYGVLVEKPEGKRPIGEPRLRSEDNNNNNNNLIQFILEK